MKESITQQLGEIIRQSKTWLELQVEFTKLTVAEKITVLTSACVVGAICGLLGVVAIFMLSFSLTDVFKLFLSPALAYLCVAGILSILILVIYIFRRPLVYNQIARYMTRLLLSSGSATGNDTNQNTEDK